ncbi:anti-sigma-D factor RsdA [Mycobacterium sp. 141]|uniref:anti-sigma-D factor RsdA n=1 Tax=Mycobacterium sp. 141 TaxID=1120797 RepID=UPI0003828FCB|nr:anti-sigma-D factor RsdA [Mycobacterium sp. 141]
MPDFGRWTSNGGDPALNEINRTDRFIEALSLDNPVYATDSAEAELAQLLAGWRDEARRPTSGVVTTRDAISALNRGTPRRWPRLPLALVGSVAAAVLCLGGFGAAVYGAGPGDALYGMRTVMFGDRPTRDVKVELASAELAQVQQLIDQGQWQAAQEKLSTITTTVATVNDAERKQQLVDQLQQLSVKVENRDPNATVPPNAPPVVLPEVPETQTSTSSTSDTSAPTSTSPTSTPSGTSSSTPAETTTSSSDTSSSDASSPTPSTSTETSASVTSSPATSSPATTSSPVTSTSTAAPSSSPREEVTPSSAVSSVPSSVVSSPTHTQTTTLPTVSVSPTAEPTVAGSAHGGSTSGGDSAEQPGQDVPQQRQGALDQPGHADRPQLPVTSVIEAPELPGTGGGGQR